MSFRGLAKQWAFKVGVELQVTISTLGRFAIMEHYEIRALLKLRKIMKICVVI